MTIFEIWITGVCAITMAFIGIGGIICLFAPIPPGISTIELEDSIRGQMKDEGMSEAEIDEYLYEPVNKRPIGEG